MEEQARKTVRSSPEWLERSVMYQLYLRAFTPEGTLAAATAKLPMLAELGIDIVYLCPICVACKDMDKEGWSPRHHLSKSEDPRNPYRISDYYNIDPEYGTDEDLHAFVKAAHGLGMKVLLDIVFFHCGPSAVFLAEHPEFVRREENGEIEVGQWRFPMLNFESNELREYLWGNLEYWIREFKVDGYRCDVAPAVPLDFWEEGRRRMEKLDPDTVMLSEGERPDDQLFAFDMSYAVALNNFTIVPVFEGKEPASKIREVWEKKEREFPIGSRFIRYVDNHDIANDAYENRLERAWGFDGMNAALTLLFTIDGIPFVYNGQEVADEARHSIYKGVAETVEWERAETENGRARLAFIRKLCELRHTEKALVEGDVQWIDNDAPEAIISFTRQAGEERVLVVINTRAETIEASVQFADAAACEPLLPTDVTFDGRTAVLPAFGCFVGKLQ